MVVPCSNEEQVLPALQARLVECLNQLGVSWEILFVDDGSDDGTFEQLAAFHRIEPRVKVVALSRNFGQQIAIAAGLAHTEGQIIAIIDADLQDPPELIQDCLKKIREGYDVVYTVRCKRKEHLLKRLAYQTFYQLLDLLAEQSIPLDAGDFCVITRRVVNVLNRMPEQRPFLRGLRAWAGFRRIGIEYERGSRAAGETKYNLRKLMGLALDGILSFSVIPLRLASVFGLCLVAASFGMGLLLVGWRVSGVKVIGHSAGAAALWSIAVIGVAFLVGVQMLFLGCIGEYIGRIYIEIKQRPRWIVRESLGVSSPELGEAKSGR